MRNVRIGGDWEILTLPRPKKDVEKNWKRQKRLRLPDKTANGIGFRVRECREAGNWKQDALCGKIAEITKGSWVPDRFEISGIERRLRMVTDLEVHALAAALSVSPCWLLAGDTAEPIVWADDDGDRSA